MIPRRPPMAVIALISGISPFATDMYLPGLPSIARELNATQSVVQLSLTAFLVSFAVGLVVGGPLSDGWGRRPFLLAGTLAFALSSVVCAVAPDAAWLVAARIVEGLGGAAAAVAARGMVIDIAAPEALGRSIATLAAINALGPILSPLIGGLILRLADWRVIFVLLAALGAVLFVAALLWLPESLAHERRDGTGLGPAGRRMATLLRMPRFDVYLVTCVLATFGFFAYVSGSSFVFQNEYHLSEIAFTLVFSTNAVAVILTTLLFRRLVGTVGADRLLAIGAVVASTGTAGGLAVALVHAPYGALWVCLVVATAGCGFVWPGFTTRLQATGRRYPGTAAALQGGAQFGVGGIGTPLVGALGGSAMAMTSIMLAGFAAALVVLAIGWARWGSNPRPAD